MQVSIGTMTKPLSLTDSWADESDGQVWVDPCQKTAAFLELEALMDNHIIIIAGAMDSCLNRLK